LIAPLVEAASDTAHLVQYDANGDGRSDLVVYNDARLVLYTQGDGWRRAASVSYERGTDFVQVGDLDGDGASELAVTRWFEPPTHDDEAALLQGEVVVYFGDRQSPWQRRVTLGPVYVLPFALAPLAVGGFDFNDDGFGDLSLALNLVSPVCESWLSGVGRLQGAAALPAYVPPQSDFLDGRLVGDFDGDGRHDLLMVRPPPNGFDAMSGPQPLYLPDLGGYQVISGQRCDLNGDGRSDVLLRRPGAAAGPFGSPAVPWGPLRLCLGNAARSCIVTDVPIPRPQDNANIACLGDLDGNGRSEVYVHQGAVLHVLELNADGGFDRMPDYEGTPFREVGDTDGDGRADVLVEAGMSTRVCTQGPPFGFTRCTEMPWE